MGQYLSVAVATRIWVKKKFDTEETLEDMKKNFDLSIYDFYENKTKEYYIFDIKKDLFCNEITALMEEIKPYCDEDTAGYLDEGIRDLESIKEKTFENIIEKASNSGHFLEGTIATNDISYLGKSRMICDNFDLVSEGKVMFECYSSIFTLLRNAIVSQLKNPLKSAVVVTITG